MVIKKPWLQKLRSCEQRRKVCDGGSGQKINTEWLILSANDGVRYNSWLTILTGNNTNAKQYVNITRWLNDKSELETSNPKGQPTWLPVFS